MIVVIEDERHAEWQERFASVAEAVAELKRRAEIPWDEPPNCAPCMRWKTCGRAYELVEYDDECLPWDELRRTTALEVSAKGVKWLIDV